MYHGYCCYVLRTRKDFYCQVPFRSILAIPMKIFVTFKMCTPCWLICSLNFNGMNPSALNTTGMTLTFLSGIFHNMAISAFCSQQFADRFFLIYFAVIYVASRLWLHYLAFIFTCFEDGYNWLFRKKP